MKRFLVIICIIGMLLVAGSALACDGCQYEGPDQFPAQFMYTVDYTPYVYLDHSAIDVMFGNYVIWFPVDYENYLFGLKPITIKGPSYETINWYATGATFLGVLMEQ